MLEHSIEELRNQVFTIKIPELSLIIQSKIEMLQTLNSASAHYQVYALKKIQKLLEQPDEYKQSLEIALEWMKS